VRFISRGEADYISVLDSMKIKHFIIISLFLIPIISFSQDEEEVLVNNQIWFDYYHSYYFKEKLEFYGDASWRSIMPDFNWMMLTVRPGVRYHKNRWLDLQGGIGLFYTFQKGITNTFEIRPWQGVLIRWPHWHWLKLSHYFRLEERLSFTTEDWHASFALRARYRISTKIFVYRFSSYNNIYIPIYAEFFGNIGKDVEEIFNNRTRLCIGVGYKANQVWTGEFHFVFQRSRTGQDDQLKTSDYLFQFKVRRFLKHKDVRYQEMPEEM